MKLFKNILFWISLSTVLLVVITSCQKMERPALGDYPKDPTPQPPGPLKFYTAFEATPVDSQQGVYGIQLNTTYEEGVNGQAYKGSPDSYIKFGSANDFANSTSFTVSFWLKKNGPPAAGTGTQWVFGLPTSRGYWHDHELGLFLEDANNPSSAEMAACKIILQDQFIEFTGSKRIPNLLNNQWHHLAFVYNQETSKLATYIDGVHLLPNEASVTDIKDGGNPRGALSFTGVSGFVIGGPGQYAMGKTPADWMHNFDGSLDQFRLYGTPLSAAEVKALFDGKR